MRLGALEDSVRELQARVRALEMAGSVDAVPQPAPAAEAREPADARVGAAGEPTPPDAATVASALALAGRSCLVLGGAYLIRAIAEAGVVPLGVGAVLGLAYGLACAMAGARSGRAGATLAGSFHLLTAALITLPLLWETTVRFAVVDDSGAAISLVMVSTLLLAMAVWGSLDAASMIVSLAAALAAVALAVATRGLLSFALAAAVLAPLAARIGASRSHWALAWPFALAADLIVLLICAVVRRGVAVPEGHERLTGPAVTATCVVLILASVALAGYTRRARGRVTAYDLVQMPLALAIGFLGLTRMASTASATRAVGAAMLVAAAGCYWAGLRGTRVRASREGLIAYSVSGVVLAVAGAQTLLGPAGAAALLSAAGLACAAGAAAAPWLSVHAAVVLLAAALSSGALAVATAAWTGRAASDPAGASPAVLLVVASIAGATVLLRRVPDARWVRAPGRLLELTVLLSIGAILVLVLRATGVLGTDAALSTARVVLLAAMAATLTAAQRRWPRALLVSGGRWWLLPGGLVLLLQGLPRGTPGSLFFALACYGGAVMFAMRAGGEPEGRAGP